MTLVEIILDEIKEALHDPDTVFLGDVEVRVNGFDDVNFC
jgi:hypothetical protein